LLRWRGCGSHSADVESWESISWCDQFASMVQLLCDTNVRDRSDYTVSDIAA
jgi:hypothetical protein